MRTSLAESSTPLDSRLQLGLPTRRAVLTLVVLFAFNIYCFWQRYHLRSLHTVVRQNKSNKCQELLLIQR